MPEAVSTASFEVEHIHPRLLGGNDSMDNLAWACPSCNDHKATAIEAPDPEPGLPARLFHPRHDVWDEHFRWSADLLRIEGISSTGRATVTRLQMNRTPSLNLRRLLIPFGLHPSE